LAADFPNVSDYRNQLAGIHNNLAIVLKSSGRLQEAEQAFRDALVLLKQLAAEFPAVLSYRRHLASTQQNLGSLLWTMDRAQEAELPLREALALDKQLMVEFPDVPDYHNGLANTMVNLALMAYARKEFRQTRELLEGATSHHQAALKANPLEPTYRQYFQNNRTLLASTLSMLGDHVGASQTAEQLAALGWNPAGNAYTAARALAQCIPVVDEDTNLPPARRAELARSYAERALTLLEQAIANGFKDLANMKKTTDLDRLRSHSKFQELLAQMEARAEAKDK